MVGTRYTYDFRKDVTGKEYVHITSTSTGKFIKNVSSDANLKRARKSVKGQVYRAQRAEIEAEIKWRGYGGTYADYQKERKRLIPEIEKDAKKRGIKKSDKQIEMQASKAAYRYVGVKITIRYYFKYWVDECVYANIVQDAFTSQYDEDDGENIYDRRCEELQDVFEGIIKEYYLFKTPDHGDDDTGANGGTVVMTAEGSNEIIKKYKIPKHEINHYTRVCRKGKFIKYVDNRVDI